MFQLLHRYVWRDPARRARKLLDFAQTEADGGRDLVRAAELTPDPVLRRLYTLHAADEERHAALFRARGTDLLRALPDPSAAKSGMNWMTPGERGLDDLRVDGQSDASLLAFLHLSEKSAASHFAAYVEALRDDPPTHAVFQEILHDETFHMNYTLAQLNRVAPKERGYYLWRARLGRLWKAYLRIMAAIAGVIGSVFLTLQYFILIPPFAWLAKRAERREPEGWQSAAEDRPLKSQY
ncbi:MAG: ferritin-like domain-containing protein [Rhizomicrobium sp.]